MTDITQNQPNQETTNILLVDDQKITAFLLKEQLAGEDNLVLHSTQDPMAAIELAEKTVPAIILLDFVLPGIDGISLLAQFRNTEMFREVPIIMLSSQDDPALKARAFQSGANDYLVKLPEKTEMLARLRYYAAAHFNVMEIKRAQKREQYLAFQSGIAEMSVSVLHNIGNAISGIFHRVSTIQDHAGELKIIAEILEQAAVNDPPQSSGMNSEEFKSSVMEKAAQTLHLLQEKKLSLEADKLMTSVEHISDVVRSHQSASKPDAQGVQFVLAELIEDSLSMRSEAIEKENIAISLNLDTLIPEINLPRNQLLQLLLNLIKNSQEAIGEHRRNVDGLAGTIDITTKQAGEANIEIRISDNGCGMESERLEKIFQFGFTNKSTGSGVGLHSAANFVNALGGKISASSDGINQGMTIIVQLPVVAGSPKKNR
jgi:two-component system, NtrC family, sensor kinase